jgi:hypothetical protein
MYTIDSDPPHRLLRLVLSGFWTEEEARAFARDQQAAVRRLGPPFGTHLTLADLRSFALQTHEVSEVIRQLVINAAATSKRIAMVGGEGLARMQFKRITARDDARMFDTVEEAEAWLLS